MDILVWGGLGNSDYLEKMMSFSNIYLYFWLKRKQGISRVYIWCFFIMYFKWTEVLLTNIIDNMLSLCPVSEDTIQELKKCMILCRFPKKYQLIKENTFCKSAYFIEKGMTRSFWLVNGEEITTSFSWEGGIVFSMDELYYNKPSEEFVETLEDVVVYKISLVDLTKLFQTNIELANWGRIIHQNEYRRLHRSHKERLTLPAKKDMRSLNNSFLKYANG